MNDKVLEDALKHNLELSKQSGQSPYKYPLYETEQISSLRDMIQKSSAKFAERAAFLIKDERYRTPVNELPKDIYQPLTEGVKRPYMQVTYKDYGLDCLAIAETLREKAEAPKRIAILGNTRYEWYVMYMACVAYLGVAVPLEKESKPQSWVSMLERSEVDALFVAPRELSLLYPHLKDLRSSSNIKQLICCEALSDEQAGQLRDRGYELFYFFAMRDEGRRLRASGSRLAEQQELNPKDTSVLLFTSGTTARSKIVALSQSNLCSNLMNMCALLFIGTGDRFLSILPLHHSYESTGGFLCPIYRGATIAICEGLRYIPMNMKECEVTILLAVPLILESFYKKINKAIVGKPNLERKFRFAKALTQSMRKFGIDLRHKVFNKVHADMGGSLRLLVSGGAAISPQILQGLQDLGFNAIQGYGASECSPIIAVNRDYHFKNNSAGLPLPDVEVKIANPDKNGIGEICAKGPNVMQGYYHDPERTAAAFDEEGFYHTADLGYIDKDGFVIITGRKKNLIVTRNGENIFPEELESLIIEQSPLVAEVIVSEAHDERGSDALCAEIYPDRAALDDDPDLKDEPLCSAKVEARLKAVIEAVNKEMPTFKRIHIVRLRETEFEKTPSHKIKR